MNQKFDLWTITYITSNGTHSHVECHSKEEVIERLKELKDNGQDMYYVNLYPPQSNITTDELERY